MASVVTCLLSTHCQRLRYIGYHRQRAGIIQWPHHSLGLCGLRGQSEQSTRLRCWNLRRKSTPVTVVHSLCVMSVQQCSLSTQATVWKWQVGTTFTHTTSCSRWPITDLVSPIPTVSLLRPIAILHVIARNRNAGFLSPLLLLYADYWSRICWQKLHVPSLQIPRGFWAAVLPWMHPLQIFHFDMQSSPANWSRCCGGIYRLESVSCLCCHTFVYFVLLFTYSMLLSAVCLLLTSC